MGDVFVRVRTYTGVYCGKIRGMCEQYKPDVLFFFSSMHGNEANDKHAVVCMHTNLLACMLRKYMYQLVLYSPSLAHNILQLFLCAYSMYLRSH